MAIDQLNEITAAQQESISEESLVKRVTRVWQVITEDATDTPYTLLANPLIPAYNAAHPDNEFLTVRSRNLSRQSGSFIEWLLTVEYSDEPKDSEQQQNEAKQLEPNPLARPAVIEWDSVAREVAIYKDRLGNGIVNSAGDAFESSITATVYDTVAVVTKNVSSVPLWVLDFRGAVNDSPFVIDGVECETGAALLGPVRISGVQSENSIQFRVLTLQLHFRQRRDPEDGEGEAPEAWILEVLDQGLRYKSGSDVKNILDDSTPPMPITSPVPLNGSGGVLSNPSASNLSFIEFDIHKRRDFSALPLE